MKVDDKPSASKERATARVALTQLDHRTAAKIVELQGGRQLAKRLEGMGIVPGTTIVKINGSLMKGPVVLTRGATQVAIGYGIARKIIVEPLHRAAPLT